MNARIERISEMTIEGFHRCLDTVARERKYVAFTQAPPLESSRKWVMENIEKGIPQYVAIVDEHVVGWADISPGGREGFTHSGKLGMGIVKAFRGKGIGAQLLKVVLQDAQKYGLKRVELGVYASNTVAIALYRKFGFRQEGLKTRARYIDGVYDDVIMMAKLFGHASSHQAITVVPVAEHDRAGIHGYLQDHWGTPHVVSRGVIHQADMLPGFIAHWNGKPGGLVTYHINGDACEVVSLNADVDGQGIGSALLEAVRKEAVSQGCTRIWLITTNDNTDAICFYQKRGYEIVAVHRHAIEQSRKLKPSIPDIGLHGIPIRDEIELELVLQGEDYV